MIRKKNITLFTFICFLMSLVCISCESDADGVNSKETPKFPDKINTKINLANVEPGDTIYIYGSTNLYYEVKPEIGSVKALLFKYKGIESNIQPTQNYFNIVAEDEDNGKVNGLDLDIQVILHKNGQTNQSNEDYLYSVKASYKVKYIKITTDDFILTNSEENNVTLSLSASITDSVQLVIDGKKVNDIHNIQIKKNSTEDITSAQIYIMPFNAPTELYPQYYSVNVNICARSGSPQLEGTQPSSTIIKYMSDRANNRLLALINWGYILVYDKNLKLINQTSSFTNSISIAPVSGLVATIKGLSTIDIYANADFNERLYSIDLTGLICLSGYDELFMGNRSKIDVYNMRNGLLKYSINTYDPYLTPSLAASENGEFLYTSRSNGSHVYQLKNDSYSLFYTLNVRSLESEFHPINKNHIILTIQQNNEEIIKILDITTGKTIFKTMGKLQSVDPITGSILFYDSQYKSNMRIRIIDKSYEEIYSFIDGDEQYNKQIMIFNNYLIFGTTYTELSSKIKK